MPRLKPASWTRQFGLLHFEIGSLNPVFHAELTRMDYNMQAYS